jgi:hypothetical protein
MLVRARRAGAVRYFALALRVTPSFSWYRRSRAKGGTIDPSIP